MTHTPAHTRALMDQASGLRRLFSREQIRFVPVVAHPYVARSSVLMEQLCEAVRSPDLGTLAVDASRTAGANVYQSRNRSRLASERLAPSLGYLDTEVVDTQPAVPHLQQPAQAFLHEVAETMPDADVVLVHGAPPDLVRLFNRHGSGSHAPRFVLLCGDDTPDEPSSYATLKRFVARGSVAAHKLMAGALQRARTSVATATRMARDARHVLRRLQHHAGQAVPMRPDGDAGLPAMYRLTEDLLSPAWVLEPPACASPAAARQQPFRARFP